MYIKPIFCNTTFWQDRYYGDKKALEKREDYYYGDKKALEKREDYYYGDKKALEKREVW